MSLDFSLTLREVPVTLDGEPYTLRELTGKDRDAYAARLHKQIDIAPDGTARGIKSTAGLSIYLLSLSLFDSGNKRVSAQTIEKFPSAVIERLVEEANKLSALDQESADELGNE